MSPVRVAGPAEVHVSGSEMPVAGRQPRATIWPAQAPTLAIRLAQQLASQGSTFRPGDLPAAQWAVVVERPDGSTLATASTTLISGLFWSVDAPPGAQPRLLVATSPGLVVQARRSPTTLDADYLRRFLLLDPPQDGTPYREVHRLPPGSTAHWATPQAAPTVSPWTGPSCWPEARLRDPQARAEFLAAFDQSVAELDTGAGALAAMLSGGLDSTFVVAALARMTTPDRPVHAFSHAPLAGARLQPVGNWDPDDSDVAAQMALAYPGRVTVTRVVNESRVQPLDAALERARRSWFPVLNPGNEVWVAEIDARADAMGAAALYGGAQGNSVFSHNHHQYLPMHFLRTGDVAGLWALLDPRSGHGLGPAQALRKRVAGPIRASRRWTDWGYARAIGLPAGAITRPAPPSRAGWVNWLASSSSAAAIMSPQAFPLPFVDPFTSWRVLAVAASIAPRQWAGGPHPRGYARLLGVDRVPDSIRLRTRRGGQAWDTWHVIAGQRDRYIDEARLLATTPVLADWVDGAAVEAIVTAWPWGEGVPVQVELLGVHRLLSLAAFIRMTSSRLALAATGPPVPPSSHPGGGNRLRP